MRNKSWSRHRFPIKNKLIIIETKIFNRPIKHNYIQAHNGRQRYLHEPFPANHSVLGRPNLIGFMKKINWNNFFTIYFERKPFTAPAKDKSQSAPFFCLWRTFHLKHPNCNLTIRCQLLLDENLAHKLAIPSIFFSTETIFSRLQKGPKRAHPST